MQSSQGIVGEMRNGFVGLCNCNIFGTVSLTVALSADTGIGPKRVAIASFSVMTLDGKISTHLPTPRTAVNSWQNEGQCTQPQWEQGNREWMIVTNAANNVIGVWLMSLSANTSSCLFRSVKIESIILRTQKARVAERSQTDSTAQADGDCAVTTDQPVNALTDSCTLFMPLRGSGKFWGRSVDGNLSISARSRLEVRRVSRTAAI